jgi:hypothetical protein
MLPKEVKGLVTEIGFVGDNLDEIVGQCFRDLLLDNF